jgi:hypothetical protein
MNCPLRFLVLFLCFYFITSAQDYPYYLAPSVSDARYQLTDGRSLPDTTSSHLDHPGYRFSEIQTYSNFPDDRGLMTGTLDRIHWGIYNRKIKKDDFILMFDVPAERFVNSEGDSVWFFKKHLLYVQFKGKDSLACGMRSTNYYHHIKMELDSVKNETRYTGPQEKHLNVSKEWKNGKYTFTLSVDIQNKRFRQKDSGKGLVLFLKNGDKLIFPEEAVTFFKNSTAVFGDLYYLSANVSLSAGEIQKIIHNPVYSIKLANEWANIAPGEAEDLRQYTRLLDKIR